MKLRMVLVFMNVNREKKSLMKKVNLKNLFSGHWSGPFLFKSAIEAL